MTDISVSITPDQRLMVQVVTPADLPAGAVVARGWLNRDEALKLADDMQKLARMLPFVRKSAER